MAEEALGLGVVIVVVVDVGGGNVDVSILDKSNLSSSPSIKQIDDMQK